MKSLMLFVFAGILEVGGGYLVWLWLRDHRTVWFGLLGFAGLALYGVIPVLQPLEHPFGRIYAAYGAVFIIFSVLWGLAIDKQIPDFRDWVGVAFCICGAVVMMWPRSVDIQHHFIR